jgi:hypothetical protein
MAAKEIEDGILTGESISYRRCGPPERNTASLPAEGPKNRISNTASGIHKKLTNELIFIPEVEWHR